MRVGGRKIACTLLSREPRTCCHCSVIDYLCIAPRDTRNKVDPIDVYLMYYFSYILNYWGLKKDKNERGNCNYKKCLVIFKSSCGIWTTHGVSIGNYEAYGFIADWHTVRRSYPHELLKNTKHFLNVLALYCKKLPRIPVCENMYWSLYRKQDW